MVARDEQHDSTGVPQRAQSLPLRLFAQWHALLERGVELLRSHSSRRRTAGRSRDMSWSAAYVAGAICLATGHALRVAMNAQEGVATDAWVPVVSTIVWAFGRLWLMGLTMHGVVRPADSRQAWAWGLIPFAVAAGPALALAAWLTSGAVTWWLLAKKAGRGAAGRAVGVAWGMHAFFVVLSWVVVNGWVAFLAAR